MKTIHIFSVCLTAMLIVLVLAQVSHAQSTTPYQLTWLTTNASTSTGNNYTLSAQINSQGAGASSGGAYTLNPVPPQAVISTRPRAYLPLVQR